MRKLYVKILWLMWLWVCFHCRLTQSRYLILKFQTWNKLLNNISWNHNIYWRNLGSLYYEVAVFDSIYAKLSMSLIPFPQSLGLLYIYIYIYLIACIKCSGSLFDVSNKTLYITVWEVSAVCFFKRKLHYAVHVSYSQMLLPGLQYYTVWAFGQGSGTKGQGSGTKVFVTW